VRAYRSDWGEFAAWSASRRRRAMPPTPETVALYITELAGVARASTIERRLASIGFAHRRAERPDPTKARRWRRVGRDPPGARQRRGGGRPITVAVLRRMLEATRPGLVGARDRALPLVGFTAALRRSELVVLDTRRRGGGRGGDRHNPAVQDRPGPGGRRPSDRCPLRLRSRHLPGAQAGRLNGHRRYHGRGAVASVDRYGRVGGRLSARRGQPDRQASCRRLRPRPGRFSAHSLWAGLATSAAAAGVSERAIMNRTGHRSLAVVRTHIQLRQPVPDNAAAQIGL